MKSGFVSLIGRPNVGKSTLLNNIIGKKVAITSNKPQTTRNIIEGIYNDDDTQIVFVDTPGIHKPKYKLGKYLNKQAYYSISDVDIVVLLIDGSEELGKGDLYVIEKLKEVTKTKLDLSVTYTLTSLFDYQALHVNIYSYTGGAHYIREDKSYYFDPKTGQEIDITTFLTNKDKLNDLSNEKYVKSLVTL